ncbi:MAG TPA: hypothetical protein PKA55_03715 [Rhodoblastus sp.]|nr:hypothetical protein [Rhodoblastus sp.]
MATGVAIFAYVAVAQNDGTPGVSGQEHLALFAKPSRAQAERLVAAGAPLPKDVAIAERDNFTATVDYAPTATIKETTERGGMMRVLRDRVIIAGPGGVSELRPGDAAPGFGRLQDIRVVDGRWTAVFAPEVGQSQSSR